MAVTVTLNSPRLDALMDRMSLPCNALIEELIDFYELKRLDILIKRIKDKYEQGLTALDIVHLSILYTLLQEIDRKVNLS